MYRVLFRAADRGVPLTLISLGIDSFDDLPEESRDSRQQEMAAKLRDTTRSSDVLARLRDGRFLIMLFDCNPHGARIAADRFIDSAFLEADVTVTVSAGVGTAVKDEVSTPEELLAAVEAALDRALAAGPTSLEFL